MKRKINILFLIVALILSLSSIIYADSEWAKKDLERAANLIPQSLESKDLTKRITREEFSGVAVKLYEALAEKLIEPTKENPFADTSSDDVLKAYNAGIVKGITETTFEPNKFLSREEAAVMLTRTYMSAMEIKELPEYEKNVFGDDEYISDWAKESVYYMAANGIINGIDKTHFAPKYKSGETEDYGGATREQAIIMSLRTYEKFKKTSDSIQRPTIVTEPENGGGKPPEVSGEQTDMSQIDTSKENFTIGFIGGSLTQGGSKWINAVKEFFENKYPDKNIIVVNAGIGGTTSEYGAMRYKTNILDKNPDLVFIEFAVNDTTLPGETEQKEYMESMVRQSLKNSKIPKIIFLYAPYPTDKDTELYKKWRNGVEWKEEIAAYYGLKSINIYDYIYADYKNEKSDITFDEYLSDYYQNSGGGYDVHGGYEKYAEAIVGELNKDFDGCMTEPKSKSVKTNAAIANSSYTYINASSSLMHYTKDHWKLYTGENYTGEGLASGCDLPGNAFSFPYFPTGVKQTESDGAMFGFMSTPGAKQFCISYISSTKGASAEITIDGNSTGTVTCNSIYGNVNYTTAWIDLPNDGKSHKVIGTVGIGGDSAVFRLGAIIQRFN